MIKVKSIGPMTDELFLYLIKNVGRGSRKELLKGNEHADVIDELCNASADDDIDDWWDLTSEEQNAIEKNFEKDINSKLMQYCFGIDLLELLNQCIKDCSIEDITDTIENGEIPVQLVLEVSPDEDEEIEDSDDDSTSAPLITFMNSGRR